MISRLIAAGIITLMAIIPGSGLFVLSLIAAKSLREKVKNGSYNSKANDK